MRIWLIFGENSDKTTDKYCQSCTKCSFSLNLPKGRYKVNYKRQNEPQLLYINFSRTYTAKNTSIVSVH